MVRDFAQGAFPVGKLSLGGIYDFPVAGHLKFGVGGLVSRYGIPGELKPFYSSDPTSYMIFFFRTDPPLGLFGRRRRGWLASHPDGAPADGGAGGDGMADNPNATSADPNAMMANPSSVNGASGSVVRYGEAHQQRSYSDNQ